MSSSAVLSLSSPVLSEVILGVDTHRDVHGAALSRRLQAATSQLSTSTSLTSGHGVMARPMSSTRPQPPVQC